MPGPMKVVERVEITLVWCSHASLRGCRFRRHIGAGVPLPGHHQPQLLDGHVFITHDAHDFTAEEHDNPVRQRLDFVQIFGDEQGRQTGIPLAEELVMNVLGSASPRRASAGRR